MEDISSGHVTINESAENQLHNPRQPQLYKERQKFIHTFRKTFDMNFKVLSSYNNTETFSELT